MTEASATTTPATLESNCPSCVVERIAAAAASVRGHKLDEPVLSALKMAVLDCIGVMIAGADEAVAIAVRRYATRSRSLPEATVVGDTQKVSTAAAALANGTMAHACDYDDSSLLMWGHTTAPVLSAALAMAEYRDAPGADLLAALAVGLEVQKVLGLAIQPAHYRIGWHPTGTLGVFGAAAAAAHLLGADAQRIARAMSIAASRAGGVRANVGTMVKPLHVGFAARDGVDAAFLADQNVAGSMAALEGADGFLQCYAPDAHFTDDILSTFASPFEVVDPGLAYKLYPCCADLHASVDAILEIRAEHALDAAEVKRIRCGVTPLAAGNAPYPQPKTPLEAKFSQEYCLAAAWVYGRLTLHEFEMPAINDPRVGRVRDLVEVKLSPGLSGDDSVSFASPAEVEVETLDGRRFGKVVRELRGHPSNPLSMADLEQKFASCVDGRISDQAARRIVDDIHRLDQATTVRSFASLLGTCQDVHRGKRSGTSSACRAG